MRIILKNSSVKGKVPTTDQLHQGELAVNTVDKKIYTYDGAEVVTLTPDGDGIILNTYKKSVESGENLAINKDDTISSALGKLEKSIEDLSVESGSDLTNHINNKSNPHNVTKDQVGLSNLTNDSQVKRSEMAVANGVATLDENGKIPSSQLPEAAYSVVGVQKFVANKAALDLEVDAKLNDIYFCKEEKLLVRNNEDGWGPGYPPHENVIYNHRLPDEDGRSNITYRWDGEEMVEISESLALGETEGTAFEGSKGAKLRSDLESEISRSQSKDEELNNKIDNLLIWNNVE